MQRYRTYIWRHGLAIAGAKQPSHSVVKTALFTLPWLLISALASDPQANLETADVGASINSAAVHSELDDKIARINDRLEQCGVETGLRVLRVASGSN